MRKEKTDSDDKSRKQIEGYVAHSFQRKSSVWRYVHCTLIVVALVVVCATLLLGAENLFHPDGVTNDGWSAGRAPKHVRRGTGFLEAGKPTRDVGDEGEGSEVARCAIGSRLSDVGVCVRSTYFPNALDVAMMNTSVDPCKNFYQYACGGYTSDFLNENKDSVWWYLGELSKAWVKKLTDDALDSEDSTHALHRSVELTQLRAFYASCTSSASRVYYDPRLDSTRIGSSIVRAVDAVKSAQELSRVFGIMLRHGVDGPVGANVEVHPLNPRQLVAMMVLHPGDEETVEDVATVVCRTHSSRVQCQADAEEIHKLQALLAAMSKDSAHVSAHEYTDADSEQDVHASPEAADVHFRWFSTREFFAGLFGRDIGAGSGSKMVGPLWTYRTAHLAVLDAAMGSVRVETWRLWCLYRLSVTGDGFSWNKESARKSLAASQLQRQAQQPQQQQVHTPRPPWRRGSPFRMSADEKRLVANSARGDKEACRVLMYTHMSSVIDMHLHSMEYDPRVLARVSEIHANVTVALLSGLHTLYGDDVSERTMQFLRDKLSATRIMPGFPEDMDHVRAHGGHDAGVRGGLSSLNLSKEDDLSLSIFKVWRWRTDALWDTFTRGNGGEPTMEPGPLWYQYCGHGPALWRPNAYYVHQLNTVFVTKAALRPPLYSPLYNLLSLYARLGVVVAHECSHAIDRTGLLRDAAGSFVDWNGRSRDKAACEEFMACVASVYEVETGGISASRTVNENFADAMAFSAAWEAFVASGIASTDLESRRDFYIIYAQGMCRPVGPADKEFYMTQALHSPPEQRVNNVVAMHDDFCDVWKCPHDADMYKRGTKLKRCKKRR